MNYFKHRKMAEYILEDCSDAKTYRFMFGEENLKADDLDDVVVETLYQRFACPEINDYQEVIEAVDIYALFSGKSRAEDLSRLAQCRKKVEKAFLNANWDAIHACFGEVDAEMREAEKYERAAGER